MDEQRNLGEADRKPVAKDPAASMLLLQTIIQNALDPGYREAATRPHQRRSPWLRLLAFVAVGGLAFGTTAAARSLRSSVLFENEATSEMREHVESLEENTLALETENSRLEAQIKGLQTTSDPSGGTPFALSLGAASERVSGPGVVVQITDRGPGATGSQAQVTDSDLRLVMNILWQAGAEAMALNGKRVGPATTVRTAGSAILVNLTPVASPYVLEVIGDPGQMSDALEVGESGREVDELEAKSGIGVSVTRSPMLSLPGLFTELRVARHPEQEKAEQARLEQDEG